MYKVYVLKSARNGKRYVGLTAQAAKGTPDLIIWPEAASPGLFPEDAEVFQQIFPLAKIYQTPLLIGASCVSSV